MKKLVKYGELLFDITMISILFIVSLVLLIPFIAIYTGIIAYFEKPLFERELLDIFKTIKNNSQIIIKLTLLLLIMILVSLLNINYLHSPSGILQIVVLFSSWMVLILGFLILIFAPIVIIKMNVNLKQLVFNSLALIMGGIFNYLILIGLCYLYIFFIIKYPLVLFIGAYFVTFAIHYLSLANINNLKYKGG